MSAMPIINSRLFTRELIYLELAEAMKQNTYKFETAERSSEVPVQRPSRRRWGAIGFLVICLPIASLGIYGLYADARYAATLPPNSPRCGNPAMGAMFLIFPIAPIFGCIGAGIGYVSAIVCDAAMARFIVQDPPDDAGQ